jgi:glycosyltransferase involved in cell wall biosynthesis
MSDFKEKIVLALPSFNEATVLEEVINEIKSEGYKNILVVNDGSTDNTTELLKRLKVSELKLVLNRGVGVATRAAIRYAKLNKIEYLVLLDADGQHLPSDIEHLYHNQLKNGSDVVIGNRFHNNSSTIPKIRKFYNTVANLITLLGKTKVKDSQSGFRLLNQKAINTLDLKVDDFGVCTEMIWKCKKEGLIMSEVPISVRYTEYSMSKGQNLFTGFKTMISIIKKL